MALVKWSWQLAHGDGDGESDASRCGNPHIRHCRETTRVTAPKLVQKENLKNCAVTNGPRNQEDSPEKFS